MSEKEMREAIDRMLADEDYKGIRCIYFMLLGRAGSQPGVQEELKKIAPWTLRNQKPPMWRFFPVLWVYDGFQEVQRDTNSTNAKHNANVTKACQKHVLASRLFFCQNRTYDMQGC